MSKTFRFITIRNKSLPYHYVVVDNVTLMLTQTDDDETSGPIYYYIHLPISANKVEDMYTTYYFENGVQHKEDGPSFIYNNGHDERLQWFIQGNDITKEVNKWMKDENIPPYNQWTSEHKVLFKLKFG